MTFLKNFTTVIISTIATLLVFELGYRAVHENDILSLTNYRANDLRGIVEHDSNLGWLHRSNYPIRQPSKLSTIEFGIRSNGYPNHTVQPGGILVVGSSHAAGAGVGDSEHWAALLEKLTGVATYNGSVGNYAFDQIVLRAETLVSDLQPSVIFLQNMLTNLDWVNYSTTGAPKPYFEMTTDGIIRKNDPVPPFDFDEKRWQPSGFSRFIIEIAGFSAVVDRIMSRYFPSVWRGARKDVFPRKFGEDAVEISCMLLRRLKTQTDKLGTRVILVSGVSGPEVDTENNQDRQSVLLEACAAREGVEVLKTYDVFRKAKEENRLEELYHMHAGGVFGHISGQGHALIADEAAKYLSVEPNAGVVEEAKNNLQSTSENATDASPAKKTVLSLTQRNSSTLFGLNRYADMFLGVSDQSKSDYLISGIKRPSNVDTPQGEDKEFRYLRTTPFSAKPGALSVVVGMRTTNLRPIRIVVDQNRARLVADVWPSKKEVWGRGIGDLNTASFYLVDGEEQEIILNINAVMPGGATTVTFSLRGENGEVVFPLDDQSFKLTSFEVKDTSGGEIVRRPDVEKNAAEIFDVGSWVGSGRMLFAGAAHLESIVPPNNDEFKNQVLMVENILDKTPDLRNLYPKGNQNSEPSIFVSTVEPAINSEVERYAVYRQEGESGTSRVSFVVGGNRFRVQHHQPDFGLIVDVFGDKYRLFPIWADTISEKIDINVKRLNDLWVRVDVIYPSKAGEVKALVQMLSDDLDTLVGSDVRPLVAFPPLIHRLQ